VHSLKGPQHSQAYNILHVCGYVYDFFGTCQAYYHRDQEVWNSHGFIIRVTLTYTFRILKDTVYTKTHSVFRCKWRFCHLCNRNKYYCHVV
jgi:hypothetical protein